MFDEFPKIGLPFTEVVIQIDNWNSSGLTSSLKCSDILRNFVRSSGEFFAALEFKVVNHINEEQSGLRSVFLRCPVRLSFFLTLKVAAPYLPSERREC